MTLSPHYRHYELPWSPTEEMEQRFRKVLRNLLIVCTLLGLVIAVLPEPEPVRMATPDIPERIVSLVIEKQSRPPPPPPKVDATRPEQVVAEQPKPPPPRPQPTPQQRQPDARERAQQAGILQLQDQLADLRDRSVVEKATQTRNLSGKVAEATRSERSLVTSSVGAGSGGINTAELSRGYGGGAGALTGHNTTQVTSAVMAAQADDGVRRDSGSTKAARSREEIELIFDRNKTAIYALYTRALRDKPDLQGKLILELTIAPSGEVTHCAVVSSELNDPDLERKLVARVKLFRFEARDVETITTTKPIDFLPG